MAVSVVTSIVDNITTIITNEVCRDNLKLLITEDGVWKVFVAKAALSSEEEAALRDALEKRLAQEPADEDDETEKRQQKENFLKEFPELKGKLEEHIRKLRALADHLDQTGFPWILQTQLALTSCRTHLDSPSSFPCQALVLTGSLCQPGPAVDLHAALAIPRIVHVQLLVLMYLSRRAAVRATDA
ncbi:apolipoprotein L2-like isoform X3 [Arvicola amphibius]|uniref:apolipoprotein L2-like isoform X3 n=1 Tax=Arvicola amphibius TaxID=1047088 RepID=UPI001C08B540|nr:apolipoprotein L2-like isoform X3 [Arvicola amphibius]